MTILKSLIVSLLLFIMNPALAAGSDMTNGVFYPNSMVECHLIAQNGTTTTNQLMAGKTYMVGNALLEMIVTNDTIFYFSGGMMVKASENSILTLNAFDQEVENLDAAPQVAKFGNHNINLSFDRGEFNVICKSGDTNSSTLISTPFSSYQLNGGEYSFRINDKSAMVYVLNGSLYVEDDKNKTDVADKGKLAIAISFSDPVAGINDKLISKVKTLNPEEITRFSKAISTIESSSDNVQFFVINGHVVGVEIH